MHHLCPNTEWPLRCWPCAKTIHAATRHALLRSAQTCQATCKRHGAFSEAASDLRLQRPAGNHASGGNAAGESRHNMRALSTPCHAK
eukprot:123576-Alexandrium_andersonii.AAC.1